MRSNGLKESVLNVTDPQPDGSVDPAAAIPPATGADAPQFSPPSDELAAAPHESRDPAAVADGSANGEDPAVRLAELAERAASTRLRQSEEEEAIAILKGLLTSGGHSLTPALAALPSLNWNVGATAVTAAWSEMSHTAREAFVTGLKREDQRTEPARRIRLSLARGLFKQDVEVAAKIIGAVCAEMKKSAGEEPVSKSERRNFDAVMIGKGRPWICQLPLADWRPAESAAVIHVAMAACFAGGNVPPFTQLSLLKWIADADRLDKMPEDSLQLAIDGVARWSPKWKVALKKEIAVLPDALAALVVDAEPAPARDNGDSSETNKADDRETTEEASRDDSYENEEEDDDEEDEEDADEAESEDSDDESDSSAQDSPAADADAVAATAPGRRMTRRERGRLRRLGKSVSQAASADTNGSAGEAAPDDSSRRERSGGRSDRSFDVREALRQIERQYSQLKTELDVARSNLRQRDDNFTKSGRGRRGRAAESAEAPMPESEVTALRQHNLRLEETVGELRARVDELTGHAEDEATSRDAFSDGPTPGERAQFQTLLGIKLAQAKSDFEAMQGRERDDVFDENYKTLLARVFDLLREHGVTFPEIERPDEHMQSM
jgi:hypothetical protein